MNLPRNEEIRGGREEEMESRNKEREREIESKNKERESDLLRTSTLAHIECRHRQTHRSRHRQTDTHLLQCSSGLHKL